MTRTEAILQYTKVVLLAALLLLAAHALTPVTHAQSSANGYSYTYVHTATSTVVAGAPAVLHAVTVNGGTGGAVTLYDDATACTVVAHVFGVIESTSTPVTVAYDAKLLRGLCVKTAAATDLTVTIR
jgi:hypothetical protein